MKKRQFLWAIVFGSMLAITGCGDDKNGGSGGSGGSAGSGGSGGGTANGSCQTICDGVCQIFDDADPDSATCLSDCMTADLDGCVPETTALVACAEQAQGGDCNIDPTNSCQAELDAWLACP